MEELESLPGPDTIRILITTDNHVGYNENDGIMGDDSWKTFDEIMRVAVDSRVDMVLQGGDLFHVNKPSKKAMYQVMKTLRQTCMGDKACELELLNDPSEIFNYNDFSTVNYEDPNLNISVPVFSIAGNHDDASGDGLLCPMDILQVSGLVNHFGKVMESDKIEIKPLLFQKGETKLALFGLASVRDERLFRTFKEGNVNFNVPEGEELEWFSIMCVHQNHTGHTNTAFLPENFLPEFLDLVIWGHEHECIPHLVHNPTKNFDVLQPGSSVATSLCDAESKLKHVFVLEVTKNEKPVLTPIPLHTVRPFIMKDITLRDFPSLKPHDKESISQFLFEEIEDLVGQANSESQRRYQDSHHKNMNVDSEAPLPLVRLRVNYCGDIDSQIDYQVENPRRFSNRFVGKVANPNNVLQLYKKKPHVPSVKKKQKVDPTIASTLNEDDSSELQVQSLVNDFLNKMQLSLLPELGLNEAIRKFVDKDEKNALKQFIDAEISQEVDLLAQNKDVLNTEDSTDLKRLLNKIKKSNSASPDLSASGLVSPSLVVASSESDEDFVSVNSPKRKRAIATERQMRRSQITKPKLSANGKRKANENFEAYMDSDFDSDYIEDIREDRDDFNDRNVKLHNRTSHDVSEDSSGEIIEEIKEPRKRSNRRETDKLSSSKPKQRATTRTPKTDALSQLLSKRTR